MPRGKKSKARAQEKRRHDKEQPEGLKDAQVSGAEEAESSTQSSHASGDAVPSTSTAGSPQKSQAVVPTTTAGAGVACKGSGKGVRRKGEKEKKRPTAPSSTETPKNDILARKIEVLVNYMLWKYKMKQHLTRGEMVKVIHKRFKEQFPEILQKACERLEVVFGLELKEAEPNGKSYRLVTKLAFQDDGSKTSELGLPTMGILVPVLSVIYVHGKCAPEEKIWQFLNNIGIYDGISHVIFGDARKLITQDFVQENYLEYGQVPDSDPPSYEFRWGPRAYSQTSREKVLDFLVKVNEEIPNDNASPPLCEEPWWEKEEKAQPEVAARGGTKGKTKSRFKSKGSRTTQK